MTNDPRQRWRLIVARDKPARDLVHRDVTAAWEAGLRGAGLPIAMTETATPRPRISFAAPAPFGMLAERELIDVVLTEFLLMSEVRSAVEAAAPVGYRCVDLYDVWLGSPTLAALVSAADIRATVTTGAAGGPRAGEGPIVGELARVEDADATPSDAAPLDAAESEAAVRALLDVPRIEVVRAKGQGEITVDTRPHIHRLALAARPVVESGGTGSAAAGGRVSGASGTTFELRMRLRLGGEGGVGRPEEVVAALGERLGRRLVATRVVRERIVLADDPAD